MSTAHYESTKVERISIRLDSETKRRIEEAAAIGHRSITSFIIASAIESAEEILKRGEQLVLSDRDWDAFYNALNNPPKPNEALRKAFVDYKSINIKSDV